MAFLTILRRSFRDSLNHEHTVWGTGFEASQDHRPHVYCNPIPSQKLKTCSASGWHTGATLGEITGPHYPAIFSSADIDLLFQA
jgi:hypothetical protein